MFEKKKLWYISCHTGCSCCADENFDQGFYTTIEAAQDVADRWSRGDGNPLASQYAPYGRYYVEEVEAEFLPDGRAIIDGSVFEPDEMNSIGRIYW